MQAIYILWNKLYNLLMVTGSLFDDFTIVKAEDFEKGGDRDDKINNNTNKIV